MIHDTQENRKEIQDLLNRILRKVDPGFEEFLTCRSQPDVFTTYIKGAWLSFDWGEILDLIEQAKLEDTVYRRLLDVLCDIQIDVGKILKKLKNQI